MPSKFIVPRGKSLQFLFSIGVGEEREVKGFADITRLRQRITKNKLNDTFVTWLIEEDPRPGLENCRYMVRRLK